MKKTFKLYVVIWALCFLLFQVFSFLIPTESKFTAPFWTGYLFISITFIGQLFSAHFAFKADEARRAFYNISLIITSYIGLVIMLIVGAAAMIVPSFPVWLGIIICVAVLIFISIIVVLAATAGTIIFGTDKKVKTSTWLIRTMTSDAEHLMENAKSSELRAEAKKVYEAVRYGDPMSNVALIEINEAIQRQFAAFEDAVKSEDLELARSIRDSLLSLLDERNKKCRLQK